MCCNSRSIWMRSTYLNKRFCSVSHLQNEREKKNSQFVSSPRLLLYKKSVNKFHHRNIHAYSWCLLLLIGRRVFSHHSTKNWFIFTTKCIWNHLGSLHSSENTNQCSVRSSSYDQVWGSFSKLLTLPSHTRRTSGAYVVIS